MMIVHTATLLLLAFTGTNAELEEVASWRLATFAPPPGFPGHAPRGYPVYAPKALFSGIRATQDKFFLAIPRLFPGQPISLGWVPRPPPGYQLPLDTPINAFPDWDWHRAAATGAEGASTNCSALVSVYHTKLDRCGRLWVLDSGVSDFLTNFTASCPPKILAFDTTTGEELHRYEFERDVIKVGSTLTNMALDDRSPPGSSCSDTDDLFIYITDTTAPGIVVYDVRNGSALWHSSPQMYPDPDWGVSTIAGESFTFMGGILGISISNPVVKSKHGPTSFYKDRIVYFQAYSSDRIYSVPTSALRAQPKNQEILPITFVGRKSSQSIPIEVDPTNGSLVFSPVSETAIASFQPKLNSVTLKAYSPDLLQAVMDLHIQPEQIWAISSRVQKYLLNTVSAEEVNLRILRVT